MGELATLITAIGGGLAAILGPVVTLVIALRRVSPREREDAANNASTDQAQDTRIAELEQRLRDLALPPPPPPPEESS